MTSGALQNSGSYRGSAPHLLVFLAFFLHVCEQAHGSSAGDVIPLVPFRDPDFFFADFGESSIPLRSVIPLPQGWRG
jgi:hypothetical protein